MSETTERKVWEHDWAIKGLREGQTRIEANVEDLKRDVNDVKDQNTKDRIDFASLKSRLEAAAEATEKAADKAISLKQYWLGVAAVCVAIAGPLLASGAHP